MIALLPEQQIIIEFHQLLQDKLYLNNIQSCNSKNELNYYIKPKDKLLALHDHFIRYGTKRATSFLIIDIDNVKTPFKEYKKEVIYKLGGVKPNWICKTNKGYHIGFILKNPLWLNDDEKTKKAQEIKRDLTLLLDGDIAGSHRLIGYWRNPLTHKSTLDLTLHDLDELHKIANEQYYESFSLFDNLYEHHKKIESRKQDKKTIAKSNWQKIDKKGFTQGNRNNFLFNKVIGMLYNGQITNNEVLNTLRKINDNVLEDNEIQKIAKSIIKYNIKPNTQIEIKQEKRIKGIYSQDLWEQGIHNYKENDNINFERQKFGQTVTTILKWEKTLNKLLQGYIKLYQEHKSFTNENIANNSNVSKRTVQRYRNEKRIENKIKVVAFKEYLRQIAPKGVKAIVTPINEVLNILLNNITFCYKSGVKTLGFKKTQSKKLLVYDTSQPNELLAA